MEITLANFKALTNPLAIIVGVNGDKRLVKNPVLVGAGTELAKTVVRFDLVDENGNTLKTYSDQTVAMNDNGMITRTIHDRKDGTVMYKVVANGEIVRYELVTDDVATSFKTLKDAKEAIGRPMAQAAKRKRAA